MIDTPSPYRQDPAALPASPTPTDVHDNTRGSGDLAPRAARRRHAARPLAGLALAVAVSACGGGDGDGGGGGGGPTEPSEARETCAATVRLDVGESAELTAGADGHLYCRIDGGTGAGAEFAVAFVDTRATAKAATGPEGYGDAFPQYDVAVGTVPYVRLSAARASRTPAAGPGDFVRTETAAADYPHVASGRETPWTEGERFQLHDAAVPGARDARVLRVYEGGFVVAWFEGDNAEALPRFLAQLDSAWAPLREHALPLLRTAYSDVEPRTSPGSGQYLIILRSQGRAGAWGWTSADRSYVGYPRTWTDVKILDVPGGAIRLSELLAHEIGHAYQAMYMFGTRPGGVTESHAGATFWGVEGGADLVSFEMVRRAAGVPLTGNADVVGATTGARRRLRQWAHPGSGTLTDGYANSAGFLRAQAARLVAAGVPEDEAVREVLRGASDGWFGYDVLGARRTGLTARMRARIPGWSPDDALLDWALAHAADDQTAAPRWQDRTYLRIREITGADFSWQPFTHLTAGGGETQTPRGYGSPHFLLLSGRGEFPFSAHGSVPGVRWRIVRTR